MGIGLSVCYDVRFPELYRHLSKLGADVLFVPAAFTAYTGKDHWQVLLQARAIENTCYVIAPAQTGTHYAMRQTHGHAMIIGPWGVILADAGDLPGVAIAEISPEAASPCPCANALTPTSSFCLDLDKSMLTSCHQYIKH